jgi:hypothetical protein
LVVVVVVVAVIAGVTIRWSTPTGEKLADSLDQADATFAVVGPCEPLGRGEWQCFVEDDPGSGENGSYSLRLNANDCWTGVRTGASSDARVLSGCL